MNTYWSPADLGIKNVDMKAVANTEYPSGFIDVRNSYAFKAIIDVAETGAPTVGAAQFLVRLYANDQSTLIEENALLTGIQTDVDGNRVVATWGYGVSPFHTDSAGGVTLSANSDILKVARFMKLVLEVTTANDGTTSTASVQLLMSALKK